MLRQRLVLMIAAAMIGFLPAHSTPGKTIVVGTCLTRGHIIAKPLCPEVCIRPVCRKRVCVVRPRRRVVITSPFVRRFVRLWPRRRVVVVRPPHVKHVVVEPSPEVTAPVTVAEPATVTVWITNSNGSRTAVKLTKSGPGYLGPRGEWYPDMPTNEQLRVVYGF